VRRRQIFSAATDSALEIADGRIYAPPWEGLHAQQVRDLELSLGQIDMQVFDFCNYRSSRTYALGIMSATLAQISGAPGKRRRCFRQRVIR
jgi:hypothetical protein